MITGNEETTIGLDGLIKMYVNHRPALPLNNDDIQAAFDEIKKK